MPKIPSYEAQERIPAAPGLVRLDRNAMESMTGVGKAMEQFGAQFSKTTGDVYNFVMAMKRKEDEARAVKRADEYEERIRELLYGSDVVGEK